MDKTTKYFRFSKLDFNIGKSRPNSLCKLGVENLEERRLLSASTLGEAAAICDLTSNSAVVAQQEAFAPIDLSNAVGDTFVVDSLEDDASRSGTLRYAIENATPNALIRFDSSLENQTIRLLGEELRIRNDITIDAFNSNITIDAQNMSSIFSVDPGLNVEINGLILKNGRDAAYGGAINVVGSPNSKDVSLTVKNTTFVQNTGGIAGAVYVENGKLRLEDVTLENNSATSQSSAITAVSSEISANRVKVFRNHIANYDAQCGAIYLAQSTAYVTNSLIAENDDSAFFLHDVGNHPHGAANQLYLVNDTIANNEANGAKIAINGAGGLFKACNSIFYRNSLVSDLELIREHNDSVINTMVDADDYQWLTTEGMSDSAMANTEERLFNDLGNSDYALAPFSAAADAGNAFWHNMSNIGADVSVDFTQDVLGNARVVNGKTDLGAYETQTVYETPSLIVTTQNDVVNPTDGEISLREAIEIYSGIAFRDYDSTIDPTGVTITFTFNDGVIRLQNGELTISKTVKIYGGSEPSITIDANDASRIFSVQSGVSAGFQGLILTGGAVGGNAVNDAGAAIYAVDANVSVANSIVERNRAGDGAVYAQYGTLQIDDVTFRNNVSTNGGAAISTNSTKVAANRVKMTRNSVENNVDKAAVVHLLNSDALFASSLVADNESSAFYFEGVDKELGLINATIANNDVYQGVGVVVFPGKGRLRAYNSIFYGNSIIANLEDALTHDYAIENCFLPESDEELFINGKANGGAVYHSGDALFVDATNVDVALRDYSLATSSIAIDQGDSAWISDFPGFSVDYSADLAGNARVINSVVDAGAYELQSSLESPSLIVTTAEDVVDSTDGKISLREAVQYYFEKEGRSFDAAVDPTGQTITFDPSIAGRPIQINGSEISFHNSMTIYGGNVPTITIDANGSSRIFKLDVHAFVTFQGLILKNGSSDRGGAIFADDAEVDVKNSIFENNYASDVGGAIRVFGRLGLYDVEFRGNDAGNAGSAFWGMGLGGIFANRVVVAHNGTNEDVVAVALSGQNISVTNSLIADNSGPAFSISEAERWPATNAFLVNVTISDPDPDGDRPAIVLDNQSRFHLLNSIVYNAVPVADYEILVETNSEIAETVLPEGAAARLRELGLDQSLVGYVNRDALFVDAQNGDYRLSPYSIAVDVGNEEHFDAFTNTIGSVHPDFTFDLARNARVYGRTVDAGAYELQVAYEAPSIIVTTTEDVSDPNDGLISLREAVESYFGMSSRRFDSSVDPNGMTITFAPSLAGQTITLGGDELSISNSIAYSMKIYAGATPTITIDANGRSRVFNVDSVALELQGLTLKNGFSEAHGGAIYTDRGSITVKNSVFEGNEAADYGGAIFAETASLTLYDVVFRANSANTEGAAVFSNNVTYANRITVTNNADSPAIALYGGARSYIANSLVADNSGPAFFLNGSVLKLGNVTIANNGVGGENLAFKFGQRSGRFDLYNSIVYNNEVHSNAEVMRDEDCQAYSSIVPYGEFYQTLVELGMWSGPDVVAYTADNVIFTDAARGDYTLSAYSIAIDAGDKSVFNDFVYDRTIDFTYDLVGNDRVFNGQVDIGAYESQIARETPSIIVTTPNDVVDPTDGLISLREAVELYFPLPNRTFDAVVDPTGKTVTFNLAADAGAVSVDSGEVTIANSMGIYGGATPTIEIVAVQKSRIFRVADGVQRVGFEGLSLLNGAAASLESYARGAAYDAVGETNGSGGAIYATTAAISVKNSHFSANEGYVGGAIFVNGGTLSVANSSFDECKSAYQGGAIAVYATEGVNTTSLNVVDSRFVAGLSERAGAVYFKDGVAKVEDSIFTSNAAQYSNGGAITVANSTLTIKDSLLTNNIADRFGGAIFAGNSTVTINNAEGCAIEGNAAKNGGAIYNSTGTVDVVAGSIKSNSATSSGGAIFSTGALTISGAFEGNESGENGGAIYAKGDVTVTAGTFAENVAAKSGGALYAISGTLAVTNSAFTSNTAQTSGGAAIRLAKSSAATIGNTTFSTNSAVGSGGAINVSATTSLTITGGSFSGNSATNSGGAIYATTGTTLSSVGANFDGNTTTKFGGAIATVGESSLTVTGGKFENGTASAGGAIYASWGTATISDAKVTSNTSTLYGAGVYSIASDIIATGAEFSGNTSTSSGGAIFASGGTVSLTDATLSGNASTTGAGGAIYADAVDELTLVGATVTNNKANGSGGAIYVSDASFELSSSEAVESVLSGNKSGKFGGAVYVSNVETEILLVDFIGNEGAMGGAVYVSGGQTSVFETIFKQNAATQRGGAVFVTDGKTSLESVEFTGNASVQNGGALYVVYSTTEVSQSSFSANTSDIGGAVYQAFGTLDISTTVFSENNATSHGGAVYQLKGESTYTEVVFNANEAGTKAGALYVGAGSTSVSRANFVGNQAELGGAISILQASLVKVDNSLFAGNSATNAAALGLGSSAMFKLSNVTVTDNVGLNAVRITGSTGEIVNTIIALNNGTDVLFKSGEVTANNTLSPFADWTYGANPAFDETGSLFEDDSYELSADSQALDAGNDAAAVGTLDLNGNARKVGTVDIGAYERQDASSSLLDEAFAELFLEELD